MAVGRDDFIINPAPSAARMGWICPRCNVVKSPDQTECRCDVSDNAPYKDFADLFGRGTPQPQPVVFPPYAEIGTAQTLGVLADPNVYIINSHGEAL